MTNPLTGIETFYDSFKEARTNAKSGDLITIYKDPKGKMLLKDGVDIIVALGVILKKKRV